MSEKEKARRPTTELPDLLGLINRLHPHDLLNGKQDRLTIADRQEAARLLRRIADDEDVRGDFFGSVKHRPKIHKPNAFAVAFVYHVRARTGEKKTAIKTDLSQLSGLTLGEVHHAQRDYAESVNAQIDMLDSERLTKFCEMYTELVSGK